jgi:hypothetical protein
MKSLNFRAVLFDLGSFCFRSAPFSVHVSQNGVEAESGERGMRENCSLFFLFKSRNRRWGAWDEREL